MIPDLNGLLERIETELSSSDVDPNTPLSKRERIETALRRYCGHMDELQRYALFDKSKKYTRNLIATDNATYALMLLCWNKTEFSPIHDHPCDGCWVKVIQGSVQEVQYQIKDKKLVETKTINASEGVLYMDDSIGLHKVGNPSSDTDAITLHLYSPPYEKCRLWLNTDDVDAASRGVTCYYSEFGKKTQ